jgi:hypothetical protein
MVMCGPCNPAWSKTFGANPEQPWKILFNVIRIAGPLLVKAHHSFVAFDHGQRISQTKSSGTSGAAANPPSDILRLATLYNREKSMNSFKKSWVLALILSASVFAASAQAVVGKSGYSLRKQAVKQTIKDSTAKLELDGKQYAVQSRATARNHKTGIRR